MILRHEPHVTRLQSRIKKGKRGVFSCEERLQGIRFEARSTSRRPLCEPTHAPHNPHAMEYNYYTPLARTDTVSTNATAPNLPGPGRNLGLLLDRVGKQVESFMNKCANQSGMGPVATAREIRQLRRYEDLTVQERYSLPPLQVPKREAKKLKKRCDKLLKFVGRAHTTSPRY
ncbi:hypothetical protein SCHPADRAFT_592897 [Schizopora paradoxa]|uniref:Uncharacterized protein n=1 Tax=Schizopora paradoxa TaxID=27342 RepID=A0A0H2RAH1_9AGAM|nr:hypothetical protein SCHPADRAFT_592897 [Schizopora paradoxa]